jgi:hypothetical protein
MRIHPREQRVTRAQHELLQAFLDLKTRHDLTEAEALRVINAVASDWIAGVAKYAIREERHGNGQTPGGLAPDDPVT